MLISNRKKWLIVIIITIAIVSVIAFESIAISVKNRKLATYKSEVKSLTEQVDSIQKYNKQLAGMNGISVSVEFTIKNTNVLSFNSNNCHSVAKEIAQFTRGEILDSLKNNDNKK